MSVIGAGALDRAEAQGIPEQLQELNAKVAALQSTVNAMQDALSGLVTGDLFTPVTFVQGGVSPDCAVVNVGTETITVKIDLVSINHGTSTATFTLQPGQTADRLVQLLTEDLFYCHFSGSFNKKAQIRGGLIVFDPSGSKKLIAVVPAN